MQKRKKDWIELIIFAILVIAFVFVYLWRASSTIISPPRFHGTLNPDVYGLPFDCIEFVTEDSILIKGWYIQNNNSICTIILLHGYAVDKSDLLDIAKFLYETDFSILLFDFRAHGASGGTYCSLGYFEKLDLRAAVDFLKLTGANRIGVMGFSMGGTVALLEAPSNPDILAVISDSGYLSFRTAVANFARLYYHVPEYPFIPPLTWVAGKRLRIRIDDVDLSHHVRDISPRPILLIHANNDKEILVENAQTIFDFAKEPKQLWIVEKGEHLGAYSFIGKKYESVVISFFTDFLSH